MNIFLYIELESHPEIAFMGRSNVGKSSLINMITNRKKLAFTSNTPGKTSEYNYFEATSGPLGPQKGKNTFFLVDLPGVGYAEVQRAKKASWVELLTR
jgi:GTP-binding protein